MEKELHEVIGQHVIYTDEVAVDHDALVTAVWGPRCVNVLYVSENMDKKDQYGRQIERPSSVTHVSGTTAHGRYYRLTGEEKRPVLPAVAS